MDKEKELEFIQEYKDLCHKYRIAFISTQSIVTYSEEECEEEGADFNFYIFRHVKDIQDESGLL